jgi:RsiW-degrading membrane proteinase PrsW (M82 family)
LLTESLPALAYPRRLATIAPRTEGAAMTRNNILYLVVGALAVAVVVLGYQLYQDRKKPEGVNINLGPGGISIEKK